MAVHVLQPVPPYSLADTCAGAPDPSRRAVRAGVEMVFRTAAGPAWARVQTLPDGALRAQVASQDDDVTLAELRFLLALDDDHAEFLAMASEDPLLSGVVGARRGMRVLRTSTVTQALVHAMAGQLITGREAWRIERRITMRLGTAHRGLHLALLPHEVAAAPPAALVAMGLAPKRAAALARLVRTVPVERLREAEPEAAALRLGRERMIGPWSIGVVALRGLGHHTHGLVGDLNLIRLCANLAGRPATADDTARLLARYGRWAGLASLHLMRHPLAHVRRHAA